MFEYETLKVIWWGIMCFIAIAFAITGGIDIGVNFLLPIVGKDDNQRRMIMNSIGPTWEGNQVWLITFGAGLFAIWPSAYATAFSSLYYALMLVVLVLILRPPGFDYRSKIAAKIWRDTWDFCLFGSSIILAIIFGVAIGNLFIGIPFYFDADLHSIYTGNFLTLLSPQAIIFGLVSMCMCTLQGALFLQCKLEDDLAQRAKRIVKFTGIGFIVTFIAGGVIATSMHGYKILAIPDLNTGFSATQKIVEKVPAGWLNNYTNHHLLWLMPIIVIIATRIAMRLSKYDKPVGALIINSLGIVFTVLTAAAALFPFIVPSSLMPNHGLTIWDACSSSLTLEWSLYATITTLPIVLIYTSWVYRVMRGKVQLQHESY